MHFHASFPSGIINIHEKLSCIPIIFSEHSPSGTKTKFSCIHMYFQNPKSKIFMHHISIKKQNSHAFSCIS